MIYMYIHTFPLIQNKYNIQFFYKCIPWLSNCWHNLKLFSLEIFCSNREVSILKLVSRTSKTEAFAYCLQSNLYREGCCEKGLWFNVLINCLIWRAIDNILLTGTYMFSIIHNFDPATFKGKKLNYICSWLYTRYIYKTLPRHSLSLSLSLSTELTTFLFINSIIYSNISKFCTQTEYLGAHKEHLRINNITTIYNNFWQIHSINLRMHSSMESIYPAY